MADLAAGEVFANAEVFNAARINAAFASAVIQKEFVSGKASITPVGADSIVFLDASGNVLGKCTLTALATSHIGVTGTTLAAGNDSRFPASVTGIRKGAGAGADTPAVPKDFVLAPTVGTLVAGAVTLDCALNNLFRVTLIANATITLSNISDGDKIRVRIIQDGTGGRTLAWTTTQTKEYVGGIAPVVSPGANVMDTFYFERIGNVVSVYARLAWA